MPKEAMWFRIDQSQVRHRLTGDKSHGGKRGLCGAYEGLLLWRYSLDVELPKCKLCLKQEAKLRKPKQLKGPRAKKERVPAMVRAQREAAARRLAE